MDFYGDIKMTSNEKQIKKIGICCNCDGAKIIDNKPCADCNGTGEVEIYSQPGVSKKPWKSQ